MRMETPEDVDPNARVLHESQIPPGTICRRHYESREGELKTGEWFVVVSEPWDDGIGSKVNAVWLTGSKAGVIQGKYLGDMGAAPPYHATCERHELRIPPKYIREVGGKGLFRRLFS